MTLADTDVLVDFLAGHDPAADRIASEIERGGLVTTAVTRFELLAGAKTERQRSTVRNLLDAIPCLPLDDRGADRAAEVRRSLEDVGQGIGMADSLIAGIALLHRATLLTRNRRHFERVPGLSLGRL